MIRCYQPKLISIFIHKVKIPLAHSQSSIFLTIPTHSKSVELLNSDLKNEYSINPQSSPGKSIRNLPSSPTKDKKLFSVKRYVF